VISEASIHRSQFGTPAWGRVSLGLYGLLILLIACVVIIGTPAVAFAASPHLGGVERETCSTCHVPHVAAVPQGILRSAGEDLGQAALCFMCHDGQGASSNVYSGPDSFGGSSGHVLEDLVAVDDPVDLTNACSGCHWPHGDPAFLPNLPAPVINSVAVETPGNETCLACHNDNQDWYATRGTYPAVPSRDASGFPVVGTFPGATAYRDPASNPHAGIPATTDPTRAEGDCLLCHNAHGSSSKYDSLNATLTPSTPDSVAEDRATGDYAALCFRCHSGGSWQTAGAPNIKQYVTQGADDTTLRASGGHRIKSSGGTLPVNAPLPCYDCHNPHGSSRGNKKLLSDALGGSFDTSAGPEPVRKFCLSCHVTSDLFGWNSGSGSYAAVSATATVEGLLRNGGPAGSGPDGGKNWLLLKVTPGHQRADTSKSCYECHGSDYGLASDNNVHNPGSYSVALHTGTPPNAGITILGVTYPSQVCADCHDLELGPEHERATSSSAGDACATCHPVPRSSLSPSWNRNTCAQGDCHAGTSSAQMHAEANGDHLSPANACTVSGCHNAAWGLAALHSAATTTVDGDTRTSCEVCHAAGVPVTKECTICHTGLHADFDHTVGGPCTASGCHGTDAKVTHDPGPKCNACHAPGVTPSLACATCHASPHPEANHGGADICTSCHSTGNLADVHSDGCMTCHPNPANGMTWNGTCSQAGCHPAYHSGMTMPQGGSHPEDHGDGWECWDCHPGDEPPEWDCNGCHSGVYERMAPVTTSDARASYSTLALIRLYPVDAGEWGWASGIRATYYQVDGGPLQSGTTVVVAGPASGTELHTVEFWSTDWHYNTETHNVAHFQISAGAPDTNPPTGTMSVNNGAVWANTAAVTVNSAVTDGETGIANMRIDPGTGVFGAWVDYSPSYPISLPAGSAVKTVRAEYRDPANNLLALSDTINFDATLPTGSMVVNGGATYTNSLTVTYTNTVTDAYSGLSQMRFMDNGNWVWSAWEPYAGTKVRTLAGVFTGTRGCYAQYRDVAGNVLQLYDGISYDPNAPTGTMSVNNNATYATTTAVTLNSSVSDFGGSLLSQMRVDPGSGTFGSWVAYNSAYPFTLASGDGAKTVRAEYRDGAGNVLARSDAITLDTGPPVGTMVVASGATTTSVTTVNVNSSMTDDGSGVSQMRVDPGTGVYGTWIAYAATYPITLPAGDGVKTVRVEYRDNVSFVAARTDTIILGTGGADVTPPTGSVVINGDASSVATTAVTLTLSASDTGGSGLAQMRFSNDGAVWSTWEAYASSKAWTLAAAAGYNTVSVQFRDGANNESLTYTDDILVTSGSTSGSTAVTMSEYTWVDAEYGASGGWGTFTIFVDGVNIGTKVADGSSTWNCPTTPVAPGARIDIVVDVGFTNPGYVWDEYRPLTYTTYLPAEATQLDGAVWSGFPALEVNDSWYEDYGGDYTYVLLPPGIISGISYTIPDGADAVPPTGSVTVNSGAASTNNTAVTLALAGNDTGGSGLAQMRFSNDNSTWSTWEAYSTSKSWTLISGSGAKTVYVQFRDGAGNVSVTYADGITLDSEMPTGSILVNGGATWTTLTTPLTLSASDTGGAGLAQMRFSNDNSTWSTWEAYSASKSWTLISGNGAKTVYAQFSDAAGNVSATYSDGVMLDGTLPTGSIAINGGAMSTSVTAVTLSLGAGDTGGSGLAQMRFSNDNSTWSTWEAYASSKAWTITSGDGVKAVYAQFRDAAGNVSLTSSDTITLSTAGTATLAFEWDGEGYAELHVEDSFGVTIASTTVEGEGSDLSWYVDVPAGQLYYMSCDYYDDWFYGGSGGGFGVFSNELGINPDGILSPGETVTWNY